MRALEALFVICCLLACQTAMAADGAASKDDLARLYKRYFDAKDDAKLNTLVYWPGIRQRERDSFVHSIKYDLGYSLLSVELAPLKRGETLEYSSNGVTFRPSLAPVCHMVATYKGSGTTKGFSTSYLVGVKDGRYYIVLASPQTSSP